MPHSILTTAPTLEQFQQIAENTADNGSIVFKNGSLVSRDKAGTIFSRHASRRAAMDGLLKTLTEAYGKDIADMVGGRLTEIRSKGKPLRAALVRDILREAYTATHNLRIIEHAHSDAVSHASQSFAQKHGLNKDQQAEVLAVLQREMQERSTLFPGAQEDLSAEDICRHVEEGLPCMKAMTRIFNPGKSPAIPFTFYTPDPAERADIAWLQAFVPQKDADCASSSSDIDLCYMLQCMPTMRRIQPSNPLNLDTVWRTCFNEAPPEKLHLQSPELPRAWSQRFSTLVADKLGQHNAASPDNISHVFSGIMGGLKLEAAVARCVQQAPITMDDLCRERPTMLHFNPDFDTAASVEEDIANDIHRIQRNGLDFSPTFSLRKQGDAYTDISPTSDEGLDPANKEQWKRGKPSLRSHQIMKAAADICAPDAHAQKLVVAMCFSQAALQLPKLFNALAGTSLSEHSPYDIAVVTDKEGNAHVALKTPQDWHSQNSMTFTIRPDGSNYLSSFYLSSPQAAAPAAAMPREALI